VVDITAGYPAFATLSRYSGKMRNGCYLVSSQQ